MTSEFRINRYSAAGEYELHRRRVTGVLERRFPRLDPDERLELYHSAWARVLEKRRRGDDDIRNLEAYLVGVADKLALKRLTRADARRRVSVDPLEEAMTGLPDEAASPEEQVLIEQRFREQRLHRSVTIPYNERLQVMLDTGTYSLEALARDTRSAVKELGLSVSEQLV